ncbi:MAG: hypothetical protein NVS3B21_24890 [Acidimicrobiales bacterium]
MGKLRGVSRSTLRSQLLSAVAIMTLALLAAGGVARLALRSLTVEFSDSTTQTHREIIPLSGLDSELRAVSGVNLLLGAPKANEAYGAFQALVERRFAELEPFVSPAERVPFDHAHAQWAEAGAIISRWLDLPSDQRQASALRVRGEYVQAVVASRSSLESALAIAQRRNGLELREARDVERRAGWLLSLAAVIGLIGAVVVALRLHRSVLRPLRSLQENIDALGTGDLRHRFPAQASLELQAVADAVNTMAQRIETHEGELSRLAHYDPLTGLPNRVLLYESINSAIGRGGVVGVFVLDLDRFKEINDTLGHHLGDELLRLVGARLGQVLRPAEILARTGGDEFAIVMTDLSSDPADANSVQNIVGRTLESLSAPFVIGDLPLVVEASGGLAVYPDHGQDASDLMQHADIALYVAKRRRGGFATYEPSLDDHTPRKLALLGHLSQAIDDAELVVHYQPILDLSSCRTIGAEALVRWQHPVEGLIPPDEFIPLAETTGLIYPLTEFVLARALAQCREWLDAGHRLPVSVNISAHNLLYAGLPQMIATALSTAGVPASLLTLEVTETAVIGDPIRALRLLRELAGMGIHLSIDDFGTGYTSMAYLRDMTVHELKIDQSFIRDMVGRDCNRSIVQTILDLAGRLGLSAVAEGVEDTATRDALITMGCARAQGYLFSRPLPEQQFRDWLGDQGRHEYSVVAPARAQRAMSSTSDLDFGEGDVAWSSSQESYDREAHGGHDG